MKFIKRTTMAAILLLFTLLLIEGKMDASAATMSLKVSKARTYSAKAGKNYYAKFKATKTGSAKIITTNTKYITLVNAKNKKVGACQEGCIDFVFPKNESKSSGYAHYATYGVKKGQTYYLKLTSCFSEKSKVKVLITAGKVYGANNKEKAYQLKNDKKFTNVVLAGKKKTWWFKYYPTTDYRDLTVEFKSSRVVEQLSSTKADNFTYTVTFYGQDGKAVETKSIKYNDFFYDTHYFGQAGKAGVPVYFKVTSDSRYNSGFFYLHAKDKSSY